MSPVFPTLEATLDFLILTLTGLQQTILTVAGYHDWTNLQHIRETMKPITEIVKREIEVILQYWTPFFNNSTGSLSVQALRVNNALLNILTVKDKIVVTRVSNQTIALLLIEYNKLNGLIGDALNEFATLNDVLRTTNITGPPLLQRQPNMRTGRPLVLPSAHEDQEHLIDMALGKNFFRTHRKKHRKVYNARSQKSRKHYKPIKPRKPRK